jgi:DNA mismatch repair ATPase MutS
MDSATAGAGRGGLVLLDEVFAGSSDSRSSDACGVRVLEVLSECQGALVVLSTHQDSLADWAEGRRGFASFMTEPLGYRLVRGRNSASNAAEQMRKFGRHTAPP